MSNFIQTIGNLIPTGVTDTTSPVDYLVIAIQRYNDSILKPEITESKISFAVMTLEAIYLKENERQELSATLGQRIARVTSYFGHHPLEVYNDVIHAYDIRSKFVHGSPVQKEELKGITRLTENILEYARLSIVVSLQLKCGGIEKESFLSRVDKSLLDASSSDKLRDILNKNCTIT